MAGYSAVLSLVAPNTYKPNRLEFTEQEKNTDEKYNLDYCKWILNNANNIKYQKHLERTFVCRNFYLNKQWIEGEDVEAFLKDDDNQDTGRLRVTMNYIQQIGNMFRGNVSKMDFYGRVRSYSPNVKTRKDAQLAKLMLYTDMAKQNEGLGSYIRNKFPVGNNEDETAQIFENVYKDSLVRGMNDLLTYGINVNRFDRMKMELAEDLFCSGIVIMKPKTWGGEYVFDRTLAERFFFDRTCIRYDLSDAMYMGEWHKMLPTEIYEKFDISKDKREAIEKWVSTLSTTALTNTPFDFNGRVPVFEIYWRDCNEYVYGYVKDEFGQKVCEKINYIEQGEDKPRYTEKDLLPNSELSKYEKSVLKIKPGDKKRNRGKLVVDYWRYAYFIPTTYAGIPKVKNTQYGGDIMLEYGIMPYGEPNIFSPTNMNPPYKVNQYIYLDGETVSPVDIAINPQRMINRFLSVFENQINNSGGSNLVYDPDMLENEQDFLDHVKRSEPAAIRTKGMPIQNVVGRYDNSIGAGASQLYNYATLFKTNMEQITGITDAVKGQTNESDKLVGVMQLQIQRGALLQEPFYASLENCFLDCFQAIVTCGKRFYLDNKRQLIIAVGEEDSTVLEMTEDMRWEDCLVTIKRSVEPEKERMATDQLIMQYMQLQLLDDISAANLIGRANADELAIAVRDFAKQKLEMRRMQAEQQQKQAQQQAQQDEQQGKLAAAKEQGDKADAQYQDNKNKQHDLDKVVLKGNIDNQKQKQQVAQK
jgi:hypothetical protein